MTSSGDTTTPAPATGRRPPSLHRRLVVAGVIVVLLLAVALDALVYVSLRSQLLGNLSQDASRAPVDAALRNLLAIEALVTLLAAGLAAVLMGWVANVALKPLDKMLGVVRRQTAGHRGERIRPDKCVCIMGVLGRAYDDMLDAQETAIAETQAARDRSRSFLTDAAHQIRTPVAGIQACAETLLRQSRSRDAEEQQLLTDMLQETSRVGRLVGDLLRAARADQGMHLQLTPCDLLAVCRHEVDRVQRLHPSLEVTALAPGWPDLRPLLDVKAVHDIVANLLDNARRHAHSRVWVTVAKVGSTVEVGVADDGPGLSDELAPRVFERFVSVDGHGGSGLGLPIARELARAHGGDLRYEDRAFVVSLPWEPEPTPRPAPGQAKLTPEPAAAR